MLKRPRLNLGRIDWEWLTGPIFAKELRISSRRRRNYWLRFIYMAMLVVFVWIVLHDLRVAGQAASQALRMAEAGRLLILGVIVFQFITLQLLAIVMLSTAITDELSHQTLGVLMTTPISGLQIIAGKLLSKLLQLILILAISLPPLAILRVLGGIPWDLILSSLCVTFTAMLFAGALSLYYSVKSRYAIGVILRTLTVLGVFYVFLPLLVLVPMRLWVMSRMGRASAETVVYWLSTFLLNINPLGVMGRLDPSMGLLRGVSFLSFPMSWPIHCLIMLLATLVVMTKAVRGVRRIALQQAAGALGPESPLRGRRGAKRETEALRRVIDPPVRWKELRSSLIIGGRSTTRIGLTLALIVQSLVFWLNTQQRVLETAYAHVTYALLFLSLGALCVLVLASTMVTKEKESGTWPVLLSTRLEDRQILYDKTVAIFIRCLPVWCFLGVHFLLASLTGYCHPTLLGMMALTVLAVTLFLTGIGLIATVSFRRTTTAVIAAFLAALTCWILVPRALGWMAFRDPVRGADLMDLVSPFGLCRFLVTGACAESAQLPFWQLTYKLPGFAECGVHWILCGVALYAALHCLAGWGLIVICQRRLRRGIFGRS